MSQLPSCGHVGRSHSFDLFVSLHPGCLRKERKEERELEMAREARREEEREAGALRHGCACCLLHDASISRAHRYEHVTVPPRHSLSWTCIACVLTCKFGSHVTAQPRDPARVPAAVDGWGSVGADEACDGRARQRARPRAALAGVCVYLCVCVFKCVYVCARDFCTVLCWWRSAPRHLTPLAACCLSARAEGSQEAAGAGRGGRSRGGGCCLAAAAACTAISP